MLLDFLFKLDITWVITAVIALFTYSYVQQLLLKRKLPPGPTPLPILGNLLDLKRKDVKIDDLLAKWRKQYGGLITIWAGMRPIVMVCDWDLIRDGLIVQKNAFSGKQETLMSKKFTDDNVDVIFSDFSPAWENLRKLAHSAVRKTVASDHLPVLIDDIVCQCLDSMSKEKGPVDIKVYMYLAVVNILATTAFGERFDMKDKEFRNLTEANERVLGDFGIGLPGDLYPYFRYLLYYYEYRFNKSVKTFLNVVKKRYQKHKATYVKGVVRDFTDALLAAKAEAEKEDSDTAVYFTDENITLVIQNLFTAGTDTTRITLVWILLYISNYPEIQEKMRQEIQENIGDRMPIQEDKTKCPYTIAVMTETLRMKPVIRFTLEHKAVYDAKLGDYIIPKDTGIYFCIHSPQHSKQFFTDPEVFRPERFLDKEGKFTSERLEGYLPFSFGRRSCPGEKLAKADIFLLISRFLQQCRFSLPAGPGTADLESKNEFIVNEPKHFKLNVERI